jgi:hypothetical protein
VNALAGNHADYFLSVFAKLDTLYADFRVLGQYRDDAAFADLAFEAEQ